MKLFVSDIETDGFDPSVIHCFFGKVVDTDTWKVEGTHRWVDLKGRGSQIVPEAIPVFHNGLNFDVPVLNKFYPELIDPHKVVDTFVVSRLVNYSKFRTHSLEELGRYLKMPKGTFNGPWDKRTKEMEDYCWQDVDVTIAVLKHYWPQISDPSWKKALRVEHEMAIICKDMQDNGFYFNDEKALDILHEVQAEQTTLESSFKKEFLPRRVEAKRIKYRTKKDGTLFSGVSKTLSEYPDHERDGEDLVCYTEREFNPGSPRDRIDALWDAGWTPYLKTKGHKKWLREFR